MEAWPEALIVWDQRQLDTMKSALVRYLQILLEKTVTPPISDELKYVYQIHEQVRDASEKCSHEFDNAKPGLLRKDYQFLSDLLHKYWRAREQEYKELKNYMTVKGEFYYEEKELEMIHALVLTDIFMDIEHKRERRKILTDSLYIQPEVIKRKKDPSPHNVTHINQTIEHNYGQAIASNQGIVNQTNNPEITEKLKSLITKVLETDISDDNKTEYVTDLEIMMAESKKKKPSRAIFEMKLPTIERLSQVAQIASFVYQIMPEITKFFNNLPITHQQI